MAAPISEMVDGAEAFRQEFGGPWLTCVLGGDFREAAALVASIPPGLLPTLADHQGNTPLHVAAVNGRVRFCALLIQAGADPDARDNYGRTPAHVFGLECGEGRLAPKPTDEDGRRFAEMLRAAGSDPLASPRRYKVTLSGWLDNSAVRGRLEAFWKRCRTAPGATSLHYPFYDDRGLRTGSVWLFDEEVEPLRARLAECARESSLNETVRLEPAV